MFQGIKDKALSTGAKIALNKQLSEYGQITTLQLNSKLKSMNIKFLLDGETEPISVEVEHYEITEDNELKISGITTSRAWINTLAHNYLEGKGFQVPSEYAQMLRAIV